MPVGRSPLGNIFFRASLFAQISIEASFTMKMINIFVKSFNAFASFMLVTFLLSLGVCCFFAHAESQFGSELKGMRGSAQLQTASESVLMISSVCLLVLSFFYAIFIVLVHAGVAVLGVVRFCAWTVAKAVLLATKESCLACRLFRRCATGCFVLFIANGSTHAHAVVDGAIQLKFLCSLDPRELGNWTFYAHVAAVLHTTMGYDVSNRNQRIVYRVSFVHIVLLVIIGVVGMIGGSACLRVGAVGLYLVVAELRQLSAATKTSYCPKLDLQRSYKPPCFVLIPLYIIMWTSCDEEEEENDEASLYGECLVVEEGAKKNQDDANHPNDCDSLTYSDSDSDSDDKEEEDEDEEDGADWYFTLKEKEEEKCCAPSNNSLDDSASLTYSDDDGDDEEDASLYGERIAIQEGEEEKVCCVSVANDSVSDLYLSDSDGNDEEEEADQSINEAVEDADLNVPETELEVEMVALEVSALISCFATNKVKTAGSGLRARPYLARKCKKNARTRPYIERKCKVNVRYSK